ncbi:hypothetical protein [Nocardia sp. NPDC004711]
MHGGQAQWHLLLMVNRPRYLEWDAEENATPPLLGKDVSILRDRADGILKPLPLSEFRQRTAPDVRRRRLGRVHLHRHLRGAHEYA